MVDVAKLSPSSRRAWIEMIRLLLLPVLIRVALLAEGVDRNSTFLMNGSMNNSRPPRGGRG